MKKKDEKFETLVAEGLALVESIDAFKRRLDVIHTALDPYFSGDGAVETIATEFGTAMRILDEKVTLDPASTPTVMAWLGSQFGQYFDTTVKCTAREKTRLMVSTPHSHLGHALREYVAIQRDRFFVFSPGKVKAVIDVP